MFRSGGGAIISPRSANVISPVEISVGGKCGRTPARTHSADKTRTTRHAGIMTMMMMQRVLETNSRSPVDMPQKIDLDKYDKRPPEVEAQLFRLGEDSQDVETCDKSTASNEELNVDVENDDNSCPVDLTRRQDESNNKFTFEDLIPKAKGIKDEQDSGVNRSESVCSDVSRSDSPRDVVSPSVVSHNRRLAFSVENILDPNKFTGRQSVYSDSSSNGLVNCCWKPHQDVNSSEMTTDDGNYYPFLYSYICCYEF